MRQFRLLVAGELTEPAADALFVRARDLCVEALPSRGGLPVVPVGWAAPPAPPGDDGGWVGWVAFDRPAPTLIDAVVSGVRDLDVAGLAIAAAIADDSLVTAFTIAERGGRMAALVPLGSWVRPVYDWASCSASGADAPGVDAPGVDASDGDEEAVFEAVSLVLRVRALAPRLERLAPLRSLL
ncbi:hypothetical protein ACQP00_47240 [Dactylosporangium sp. CS-047395]|uniref:hypothetical protein n=1 Tax=Dactylosporangium sp. CS-047395 TaxID=3239936 RepID=UPI003D8C75F9